MKKQRENNSGSLPEGLNKLLAAYQVAYFNARACHWMVKGGNFFELHKLFETVYNDATTKIDEIAERILTLGGTPLMTGTELIATSAVKEQKVNGEEKKCVELLLEDLRTLADIEKGLVQKAEEHEDIVTADQLTGYMAEQQKTGWMLSQFLSRKSSIG